MERGEFLAVGARALDAEIDALVALRDSLGSTFVEIVDLILSRTGTLVITGMG